MPPVWEAVLRCVGGGALGVVIQGVLQGGGCMDVWLYGCMAVWLYVLEYGMWRGEREGQRERRREREVCIQLITI